VALTNEPTPYLVLRSWRNPLASGGIEATASGTIVAQAAEGYPPFFAKLGVKPAAIGGDISTAAALEPEDDSARTREIRATDIVLAKPRIGTRLDIRVGDPLIDAQTQLIDAVFVNDHLRSTQGRARLRATSKYVSEQDQSLPLMYGTLLRADDPQFDDLHIATVWIVSPPDVEADAQPDHTWTAYPQHFVFWNLNHATRILPPSAPQPPLTLRTGLAGGVGDRINDALLSFINDSNAEAHAFLNQADARGRFWST
jgi:hypothetical protein